MTRILLVFTGGTIGSQSVQGRIDTDAQAGYRLLEMFAAAEPAATGNVCFQPIQALNILSENLHPRHWSEIIASIEAADPHRFDGIIVTHGTDTLAFTAAALALYFHALPMPLLLVSSDLPLTAAEANGLANFRCAVAFIRTQASPGAFVAYQNRGGPMLVHIATRLASCLQLSSDFIGIRSQAFLRLTDDRFLPETVPAATHRATVPLRPSFSDRVLLVRPYPGLDYSRIVIDGADAILHDLYHSGTACTSAQWGERHDLPTFLDRCRQRQLPVFLAPGLRADNMYASTAGVLQHGAHMLWNMSLEAAYAKLTLAYGNFDDIRQIADFLEQDLALEHL